ncbi:MAG: PFL_4695 family integrating conjugative element protein [Gammaproteobacteria bacterium]
MTRVPLVLAVGLSASLPGAALEVIRDAGGEPIGPYLARLAPEASHGNQSRQAPAAHPGRAYRLTQHLPIRSPSLSSGAVQARHRPTRLLQPVFLVGADPRSLAWLEANHERLKQLHAIGMLVQAENEAELNRAIAAAQGLPLIPASGEAFATALGIGHYPVLITREGFEP